MCVWGGASSISEHISEHCRGTLELGTKHPFKGVPCLFSYAIVVRICIVDKREKIIIIIISIDIIISVVFEIAVSNKRSIKGFRHMWITAFKPDKNLGRLEHTSQLKPSAWLWRGCLTQNFKDVVKKGVISR